MVQTAYYRKLVYGKLLDTVLLGYVFKNANISNNSRVSKTDVKSYSSQYILDGSIQNHVLDASLFEKAPDRSNSEI